MPGPGLAVPPTAESLTTWVEFPFVVPAQEQTNWCWAAIASAVGNHRAGAPVWTQCALAGRYLERPCCSGGAACNQPQRPADVLGFTGDLRVARPGAVLPADLAVELSARCPVVARILWNGGGSHVVAIHGMELPATESSLVRVQDPWFGHAVVLTWDDLRFRYRNPLGVGWWKDSCLVWTPS